jgi:hypothetical protein
MRADTLEKQLHEKATRGVTLSAAEQAQLGSWYARQDQEEDRLLAQAPSPQALVALQAQIDTAVVELLTTTQRIQALAADNAALRRDIAALQQQLTHPSPIQSV